MKRKIRLCQHADPNDTSLMKDLIANIRGRYCDCISWKYQTVQQDVLLGMCWKGRSHWFKISIPCNMEGCECFERTNEKYCRGCKYWVSQSGQHFCGLKDGPKTGNIRTPVSKACPEFKCRP